MSSGGCAHKPTNFGSKPANIKLHYWLNSPEISHRMYKSVIRRSIYEDPVCGSTTPAKGKSKTRVNNHGPPPRRPTHRFIAQLLDAAIQERRLAHARRNVTRGGEIKVWMNGKVLVDVVTVVRILSDSRPFARVIGIWKCVQKWLN